MKTERILLLISGAAVLSLIGLHSIHTFLSHNTEGSVTSLNQQLLTDCCTMKEIRSTLQSEFKQQDYVLDKVSKNLTITTWNTSLSASSSSYTVHIPYVNVPQVNCVALFNGDIHEVIQARIRQAKFPKQTVSDEVYIDAAADCTQYIIQRRFTMHPLSNEEAAFPLAFSIIMFRDVGLFERLLRAIYRQQNFYCIHVDRKSPLTVHRAVHAIASCFSNVFIAPRIVNVLWGSYSVLEAELICMEALLSYSRKWRYFINLTGQEFPLKTNWDIVKILKVLNGANNVEGTVKRLLTCVMYFLSFLS